MTGVRVLGIDAASYQRHPLHEPDMPWQETNCYVDIWIELIHAFGFPVEPCLGFTLTADFEQDQWTFFKPSFQNLQQLYGFRTEELALWRSLPEQCATQVANGSLPLLEVDAFHLPDTQATDYQRNHAKTTIGINEIDLEERHLGYFHNAGYHTLSGTDFEGVFLLNHAIPVGHLPPYCEIVKTSALASSPPNPALVIELLRLHVATRPASNPFRRYTANFERHLEWITDMKSYHAYAFATLRQCGASFDLAARHMSWLNNTLDETDGSPWRAAALEFKRISASCKTLLLKLARVASGKPPRGLEPLLADMTDAWDRGMALTTEALEGRE